MSGTALGKKRAVEDDLTEYGFTGHEEKRLRMESASTGCQLGIEYGVCVIYSDSKVTKTKREYLETKTADNLSATIHGAWVPAVREYVDGDVWLVADLLGLASSPSTDLVSFSRAGNYLMVAYDPITGECMVYGGSTGCLLDRFESHITEVMKGLSGRSFEKKKFYQWCVDHKVIPKCVIVMFDDTEDNEPHFNETAEAVTISIFNGFEIDDSLSYGKQACSAKAARHESLPDTPWAGGNASWPVMMGHATSWPGVQDFQKKTCSRCGFSCFKDGTMAAHQFLEHKVKRYKCPFCNEAYHNAMEAKAHTKEFHPGALVCGQDDCGRSFAYQSLLEQHVKTHNSNRPMIPCTFPGCTKVYVSLNGLNEHLESHKPDDERKRFSCTFTGCSNEYKSQKGLQYHLETHKPDDEREKFPCIFTGCSQEYKTQKGLNMHLETHKLEDERKRFPCTFTGCNKEYKSSTGLQDHLESHKTDDERTKYPCTFPGCSKVYSFPSGLSVHLPSHSSEPRVKAAPAPKVPCTVVGCGKMIMPRSLKRHVDSHAADRPEFPCTFVDNGCEKTFSYKSVANKHAKNCKYSP